MKFNFWWIKLPDVFLYVNLIFDFFISFKNFLKKRYKSKKKVICVGNFTLGGAGKTPMVRHLRYLLTKKGYKCVVLLRGYKGSLKGPLIVNSDNHLSDEVGDEALMHAKDGLTIVSKNRVEGCKFIENLDIDLILLDDGFQNPSLKKDYTLMVVSSNSGIGNKLIFPFGPLRQSIFKNKNEVNMVLKAVNSENDHHSILYLKNFYKKLIHAEYQTHIQSDISTNVVVFTGIADPDKFLFSIEKKGKKIIKTFLLKDHQEIDENLAQRILNFSENNEVNIITTEKDFVRLSGSIKGSFKEKLLLNSRVAPLKIKTDDERIINDIHNSLS